jgi:hypothetical protein
MIMIRNHLALTWLQERVFEILIELVPKGTKPMTTCSPEPERTLWIFFTLFHTVKTVGEVVTLLSCNLNGHFGSRQDM